MSFIKPSLASRSNNTRRLNRMSQGGRLRRRLEPVLVLRIIWTVTIIWAEWIYFDRSISNCTWPMNSQSNLQESFKVLIIADPQLPSMNYSYPTRPYILRWLSIKIIDQFMRKSWRLLIRNMHPDAIVFLGDLLDGGITTVEPIEFQSYVNRFYRTFTTPNYLSISKNQTQVSTPNLIHLVGNHDVGLYPYTTSINSTHARERFVSNWSPGQLNGKVEWANHTIIWFDALSLIEETNRRLSGLNEVDEGEVTQFVNGLNGVEALLPKILFTHVPLWRPEGSSCGPLRESNNHIHQGSGINYQNEISEEATKHVLEKIQPTMVFSGDDHDYCEVVHTLPSTSLANPSPLSIQEISVKSFSMGMGVHQPGYHLLVLSNPARFAKAPDAQTIFHKPCLLPNQIWIYTHIYLPLLLISLIVLFGRTMWNLIKTSTPLNGKQAKTNGLPIHHRTHSNALSRTLMFSKSSPDSPSSSSESSADNVRSDDESSQMFMSRRARRSASIGLGIGLGIGLDHTSGEVVDSTKGPLNYHSPVNPGPDDGMFCQTWSGAKLEQSERRQSTDYALEEPTHSLPHHQYVRGLSSRFQSSSTTKDLLSKSSDRIIFKLLRLIRSRRLTERIEKWLIEKRILTVSSFSVNNSSSSSDHLFKRRSYLSSKRNQTYNSFLNFFKLFWVICLVYSLMLIWFN